MDTNNIKQNKNSVQGNDIGVGRDFHIGDININSDKKTTPKELTSFRRVNPAEIIGRGKDLQELHHLLFNNKKVVVVNGLGGIGKTTLAEAYTFQYFEEYHHIAWITQQSENLSDDFAQSRELIKNLLISTEGQDPQSIFLEIITRLRNVEEGPNLLVIDNAFLSVEAFLDQLPGQPNWHLLVTSREQIAGMHLKELGFLSPAEAVDLFKKHCSLLKDDQQIAELVQTVGYHTLTIELLAKTAERQHCDLQQLQQVLKNDLKANVKTHHSRLQKIEKVTSYLTSIFDLSQLSEQEHWLMKQFACLPPEFHAFALLKSLLFAEEDDKKDDFADTLASLQEKGWILRDKNEHSYKMHRIIATVVERREEIQVTEVEQLLEAVSDKLSIDDTKDNPVDKFIWIPFGITLLEKLLKQENESIAHLQNNLGRVLRQFGKYHDAKFYYTNSLNYFEKELGEEHELTAILNSNLSLVLQALGDFAGAMELLEKAKRSDEKNFGEDHPNTAVSYSNLAMVLQDLGDFAGARELLEKAKQSDEKNFGENHPITTVSYSNLALVLQDLGDFEGARELLQKVVVSAENSFGEWHPQTAIYYSNLATVLQDLGDFEGARKLLEKATLSDEKNFGEEHPSTARSYSNLALVLKDLGDFEKALPLAQKALAILRKFLPEGHSTIKIVEGNMEAIIKAMQENK